MGEDPGLYPQRTTLASTRTAIACGAFTGLLIRHAVVSGRVIDVVGAVLGGVMTVSVLVLGRLRRERIKACIADDRTPAVPRGVAT